MPCSSNHHHHNIVLCLFLLSFLSVTNSQSWPDFFFASITNETPKLDVLARCYLNGEDYHGGESSIEPGDARAYQGDIVPGKNNTISCDVKLGNNHGFFRMFDLNDTSICHTPNTSDCHWYVQEDGLCWLVEDICVMFEWEPIVRHNNIISSDEHIMWKRSTP
ncbi:hypothetical protein BC332_15072 [Capsicum chinense]|nr:hypothetical protein BC332_15072 [Capsicum chinense]